MNLIRAFRGIISSAKKSAPQSQLEYLFATKEGSKRLDQIIAGQNDEQMKIPFVLMGSICLYSGVKAKRLQDGLLDAIRQLKKSGMSNDCDGMHCSFDGVFVEVAALILFCILQEYWIKEDRGDYDDEPEESRYFDALKGSLNIANSFIPEFSSVPIPAKYLINKVVGYSDLARRGQSVFEAFNGRVIYRIAPDKDMLLSLCTPLLLAQCMITCTTLSPDELRTACKGVYRQYSSASTN